MTSGLLPSFLCTGAQSHRSVKPGGLVEPDDHELSHHTGNEPGLSLDPPLTPQAFLQMPPKAVGEINHFASL